MDTQGVLLIPVRGHDTSASQQMVGLSELLSQYGTQDIKKPSIGELVNHLENTQNR